MVRFSESKGVTVPRPPPGKGSVVFMRPSSLGVTTTATVYKRQANGDLRFITTSVHDTAMIHHEKPGRHIYVVVSEAADFIEVNVGSGLIYPVVVAPRVGAFAARFSLKSACPDTQYWSEVAGWLKDAKRIYPNEKSKGWFKKYSRTLHLKTARYWNKWISKPVRPVIGVRDGVKRIR